VKFNQVTIVGLGLIGGSLGMALKKRGVARRVIGFARRETTIRRAKAKGAVDDGCTGLCPEWLGESDLVVIATPPPSVPRLAREVARLTRHPFLLTDVAGTKGRIVREVEKILPPRIRFIGGHPMAGSERSGIGAADAALFEGAACILTPTARTDRKALARVSSLWRTVGGRIVRLSPFRHDALVAQISHLPHLAAAGLVLSVSPRAMALTGNGFSDATRIALGDPSMWADICLTNPKEISKALSRFVKEIKEFQECLRKGDRSSLRRKLQAAQMKRQKLIR